MKNTSIFSVIVCQILISNFCLAGELQPAAAPAPTMKTLDQIEPGIPITSLPVTISTSGSYYLTGNLSCSGNAISVDVNNVTIDLQGFTITGNGSGNGVYMLGKSNVEIRNGTIRNFQEGIQEAFATGRGHRVIDIRALKNSYAGIHLVGRGHTVKDCTVMYNATTVTPGSTGYGIYAGVRAMVTGNVVHDNGTDITGFFFGLLAGDGSVIIGNTVNNNGLRGTYNITGLGSGVGCVVKDNSVFENAISCYSSYTGMNISAGCTVIGNSVYSNGTGGVGTTLFGLSLGANCLVDQNVSYNNTGANLNSGSGCVVSVTNKY